MGSSRKVSSNSRTLLKSISWRGFCSRTRASPIFEKVCLFSSLPACPYLVSGWGIASSEMHIVYYLSCVEAINRNLGHTRCLTNPRKHILLFYSRRFRGVGSGDASWPSKARHPVLNLGTFLMIGLFFCLLRPRGVRVPVLRRLVRTPRVSEHVAACPIYYSTTISTLTSTLVPRGCHPSHGSTRV